MKGALLELFDGRADIVARHFALLELAAKQVVHVAIVGAVVVIRRALGDAAPGNDAALGLNVVVGEEELVRVVGSISSGALAERGQWFALEEEVLAGSRLGIDPVVLSEQSPLHLLLHVLAHEVPHLKRHRALGVHPSLRGRTNDFGVVGIHRICFSVLGGGEHEEEDDPNERERGNPPPLGERLDGPLGALLAAGGEKGFRLRVSASHFSTD